MKREYPLFIIDRSKSETYPNDYIVCLDREVGFVAQVLHLPNDNLYSQFVDKFYNIENKEIAGVHKPLKKGGLILQVLDFLYYFEVKNETKNRIQVLLKKAFKKYMHAEVERTPFDDLSIENQIKQQQLSVEHAKSNYEGLLRRTNGDKKHADYTIALAEATLESLKTLRDNQKLLNFNLN